MGLFLQADCRDDASRAAWPEGLPPVLVLAVNNTAMNPSEKLAFVTKAIHPWRLPGGKQGGFSCLSPPHRTAPRKQWKWHSNGTGSASMKTIFETAKVVSSPLVETATKARFDLTEAP